MDLKKLIADVEARAGVTKAFQFVLGASLLINCLLAGTMFTMDRTVRTILVPPEITKTFWIDGRSLGPEYLEQMGSWVVSQYATVSPASIDYQNSTLLRYVHPSVNGELSIRFRMGANRLKSENISKIFMPREVRISENAKSVVFIGTQSTYIADKRVPDDQIKAYLVTFDYDGSRTFIKELRETNPEKPFEQFDAPLTEDTQTLYQAVPSNRPSSKPEAVHPDSGQSSSIDTTTQAKPLSALPPSPRSLEEAHLSGATLTTTAPR